MMVSGYHRIVVGANHPIDTHRLVIGYHRTVVVVYQPMWLCLISTFDSVVVSYSPVFNILIYMFPSLHDLIVPADCSIQFRSVK
jgi:hypothetical protein